MKKKLKHFLLCGIIDHAAEQKRSVGDARASPPYQQRGKQGKGAGSLTRDLLSPSWLKHSYQQMNGRS
jgi:hypothetical protein